VRSTTNFEENYDSLKESLSKALTPL